jgi:hypothetical protein
MRRLLLFLLAAGGLGASACGNPLNALVNVTYPKEPAFRVLTMTLPTQIDGYDVRPEPKQSKLLSQGGNQSYIDAGQVFSMRQNGQLYGVIQVEEFVPDAHYKDPTFQNDLVSQIGSAIMRPTKIQGQTVYVGAGNKQVIYVWFRKRLLHVLETSGVQDPSPIVQSLLGEPW